MRIMLSLSTIPLANSRSYTERNIKSVDKNKTQARLPPLFQGFRRMYDIYVQCSGLNIAAELSDYHESREAYDLC
jgi:hypothetical protein